MSKILLVDDTELSEKLFAYLKAEGFQVNDVSENSSFDNKPEYLQTVAQPTVSKKPIVIKSGEVEMNLSTRQIICAGQLLELTSTEYNLLEVLVRSAGFVVTKKTLSQQGLGKKLETHDRSLDMHISNLRCKLSSYTEKKTLIKTVRGVGYQFIVY